MRKLLVLVLLMTGALLLGSVVGAMANPPTPAVWADPTQFQRYSYTWLHIRASVDDTNILGIAIRKLDSATWWILKDASSNNVTVWLDDVNDEVRTRFGAGGQAAIEEVSGSDPDDDIIISATTVSWWHATVPVPNPLDQGEYEVQFKFKEGTTSIRVGTTGFFAIPEVPLGVAAALLASLAGLGLRRLRRKY